MLILSSAKILKTINQVLQKIIFSGNYRYKLETFIGDKNYNPNDISFYSKVMK